MNETLMTIINKFRYEIYRKIPYGEYYKGDIIKWVNSQLETQSIEDKRLLRTIFLNIAITYFADNVRDFNENVLNAQRVILYFEEKSKFLNLKSPHDAAEIILLFRILQKELKIFDNTDEDVKEILYQVFDFGKENIKTYFQRKIKKDMISKTRKLFKCEWTELY
jgi:hypothetical protein